jgi:hypothetical protein
MKKQLLSNLFRKKNLRIQYEIWAADYFDYREVEWNFHSIYADKEQAETELQKLRKEAGGEHSIIKFRLKEKEVK